MAVWIPEVDDASGAYCFDATEVIPSQQRGADVVIASDRCTQQIVTQVTTARWSTLSLTIPQVSSSSINTLAGSASHGPWRGTPALLLGRIACTARDAAYCYRYSVVSVCLEFAVKGY